MLRVVREVGGGHLELAMRWVEFSCPSLSCPEHYGVLGSVDGEDRWVMLHAWRRGEEEALEAELFESVDQVRSVVAAFGLPWAALEGESAADHAVHEQGLWSVFAPQEVVAEMAEETPEELRALRDTVGAELWRMGEALAVIGSYRRNVGGRWNPGRAAAW